MIPWILPTENLLSLFRTTMRAIYVKSIFFAYLGLLITAIQQLVTVPLTVSVFGEVGYGLFATYLSLAGGVATLLGWLATASAPVLSNALHSGAVGKATALYQTLRWVHYVSALVVCLSGLLVYFCTPVLRFGTEVSATLFLAALLYSLSLIITGVEPTALFAAARTDLLNRYRCISQTIVLALVLFVLLYIPSLPLLFLSFTTGSLLLYYLCQKGLRESASSAFTGHSSRFHAAFRGVLLRFTSLAGSASALRTLLMLDPLAIAWLIDPAAVTVFSYYWLPANFVILGLWKFSENAQPFFMKAFAEQRVAAAGRIYRRIFLIVAGAGIAAAGLYVLCIKPFQQLWVSYNETDYLLATFFALYILCASIYRLDFAVLYAQTRFKDLLVLSLLEFFAKFVLAWFLVPSLGPASTIAAHTVTHLLILQWYAKFLVYRQFRPHMQPS